MLFSDGWFLSLFFVVSQRENLIVAAGPVNLRRTPVASRQQDACWAFGSGNATPVDKNAAASDD